MICACEESAHRGRNRGKKRYNSSIWPVDKPIYHKRGKVTLRSDISKPGPATFKALFEYKIHPARNVTSTLSSCDVENSLWRRRRRRGDKKHLSKSVNKCRNPIKCEFATFCLRS